LISFTQAEISVLPHNVAFAVTPLIGGSLADQRLRSEISRKIFLHLAKMFGASGSAISIQKEDSGRPVIYAADEQWGASITHSRGIIACAINRTGDIGIDLESMDRTEHPALRKRVISAEDDRLILEKCTTIRLWTIKEAVLKMKGSGLRAGMKNVAVYPAGENLMAAEVKSVDKIRAVVYSGSIDRFWIALAWPGK
jgi:phosphopantetheinyl transferase